MIRYITCFSILLAVALAVDHTVDSERELVKRKKVGLFHHRDLAILYALLAIKFKAVLFVGAVILGAVVYFKLFHLPPKIPRCPPVHLPIAPYESHHPFAPHSDRRDRSVGVETPLDFDLLLSVMRGVNTSRNFNDTFNKTEDCKKQILCEAKQLSAKYPVVQYAMRLLRENLGPYRILETDRRCVDIFPKCNRRYWESSSNQT